MKWQNFKPNRCYTLAIVTWVFTTMNWIKLIDILLIGILCYQIYKLTKERAGLKIILGFLIVYGLAYLGRAVEMPLLSQLLSNQPTGIHIAMLIIFQYEIRKFLSNTGELLFWSGKRLFMWVPWRKKKDELSLYITAIVEACKVLGGGNTGALIVLANTEDLKSYIESGDLLDALASKRLLIAIFNKESPLHDGAIIIYGGKIVAARCILPVTESQNIPAEFGLRHRAAIGMSETTDTLVIVVSEETGQISIAKKGILTANLSGQELRVVMNEYLKEWG